MQSQSVDFESLPELLTVADIQKLLRISRGRTYSLIHAEKFPTVWIGRVARVPKQSLCAWIEAQAAGGKGKR